MRATPASSAAILLMTFPVKAECQQDYQHWQEQISQSAACYPGFLGQEILPPIPEVQSEWAMIFRFQHPESLHQWLHSSEYQQLLRLTRSFCQAVPHQQLLVTGERPGRSVSVIFTHKLKPGCEAQFRKWQHKILQSHRKFPGFLALESLQPIPGVQSEWIDIARFSSAERLKAWLDSPQRSQLLRELQPLVETLDVRPLTTSFEGWFAVGDREGSSGGPPPWKQALAVLFCLYPVVMLITLYISPHLPQALPINILLGNILSIVILTWLAMPVINRLLSFWLQPKRASVQLDIIGMGAIALALLLMLVGFQLA